VGVTKEIMRILRFDIMNDKKVASFIHDANGAHVEIAGRCGVGKTTAASALWDIVNSSKDCLKHGTRKGHITLHLGEGGRREGFRQRVQGNDLLPLGESSQDHGHEADGAGGGPARIV